MPYWKRIMKYMNAKQLEARSENIYQRMTAPETSENQARWSLGDAQSDLCPDR
jgi:hypothetical protein